MREHKKSHLGIMGWAMFLAGAMSLGSCSSDETLESIEREAITFGSVSMENLSRAANDPSYGQTTNLLDKFQVWGTVKGNTNTTVKIFNGAEITREQATYGAAWTQKSGSAQYWIPNAEYNFIAIANATDVNFGTENAPSDLPTDIDFTLTDGSTDLLLGGGLDASDNIVFPKTVTTDATATPNPAGPVAFTMTHLLSKVHFTFDSAPTNVAKIEVTGHYGSGTYNISNATWGSYSEGTALSFGGVVTENSVTTSANACLIIPGKQTWTIKLYEKLENSQYKQIGKSLTLDYTAANDGSTSGGFTFAPNTQYNINISLGVDMALAVEVQDWEGVEVPNDFAKNVTVSSGYIHWTDVNPVYVNAAGQATTTDQTPAACWVVFDKTKTSATFTFKIDAPMGGTWNAMLVTKQGTSEVFKIVKAGTDEELTSGKVGETYTLTIKTIEANASELANMAELRILVRQGGEILPANNLVYHGTENHPLNGKNYIMVQNK